MALGSYQISLLPAATGGSLVDIRFPCRRAEEDSCLYYCPWFPQKSANLWGYRAFRANIAETFLDALRLSDTERRMTEPPKAGKFLLSRKLGYKTIIDRMCVTQ